MKSMSHEAGPTWQSHPRWYLWEGGFLLIARAEGVVPLHAHHAIQVVLGLDGEVAIRSREGDWRTGRGVVVGPDVEHSFDGRGSLGAMLFVDPESNEGGWLRSALREEIAMVPASRLAAPATALRTFAERPFESGEIGTLIREAVTALCPGAPPRRTLDPRVTKVLGAIRASDDLRVSLAVAGGQVYLSPSRFAHLFRQQVGLPFSRYMLWRKLSRAMVAMGSERTIAAAAHAADFADAAHLTRTFHQMLGLAPSALMRGDFAEIAAPFTAAGSDS